MLWFNGSIPDAISLAKQRNLVFVVVITGDDEQSVQLLSSWEDARVSAAAQSSCVAIKVDTKSDTCLQFSQIYPVVCVPSSFFIGESGIPLEVIAGSVSPEELMKRIQHVNQMHAAENRTVSVPPPGPVETQPSSSASLSTVASELQSESQKDKASLSSPVGEASAAEKTSSDADEENLDTRVERLTKKLEERREQKKKGEEENQIKKEMERRKVGKDMQDFKKKQEDEKTKRLLEERNREKAEEKAARERVKQQIAMDRAERAARFSKAQEEQMATKQALLQARQAEQEARKESMLRERSTIARIQFRLPDGSSITNQFSSQGRLQEAWQFAAQEVGNRYGNFTLATMFPRREFTSKDLNKTLLELELVPSASIVLLPQSSRPANAVIQSSSGGVWAVLGTLLYPLLAVWRFLSSFLFVTPPSSAATPSQGPAQQSTSYTNPTSASNKAKRESLNKQSLEDRPKEFKKDGKICRLRTQDDSEDDNNTWNGNSTQQM
ncbi:UBX domain-containing protein 4 [Gouania willdenowi]|uniref:UBX domain-containing protein 4 n=1 Tax=Gouania willdenowi TaxID=441366 RepID=UPI0010561520|nr:UBX domain-containing protein 4 [Gouania willdenowi]